MSCKYSLTRTLLLSALACLFLSCDSSTKDELVVIHTRFGDMKVLLYEETPLHKANFLKLVKAEAYDSTQFYRVIQEFMVQGGNVEQRIIDGCISYNGGKTPLGKVPAEFLPQYFHHKGALAAARIHESQNPQKMSSGDQFYLVQGRKYSPIELDSMVLRIHYERLAPLLGQLLQQNGHPDLMAKAVKLQKEGNVGAMLSLVLESKPLIEQTFGKQELPELSKAQKDAYTSVGGVPFLDGGYTVFGRIVEGLAIVDSIAAQPCDKMSLPITPVYIKMKVEKMEKEEVTAKYGYAYPTKK